MGTQPGRAHPPEFIRLLANDVRWGVLQALSASDYQVNELVARVQQPANLVSYHLKKMRDDGLVTTRRSEADGRDIYYSLDITRLRQLYLEAGHALHPAIMQVSSGLHTAQLVPQRVLFLCTHNSARSQMAEGLLRHLSAGQLEVFSAGSHPTAIHPDAIRTMDEIGIDLRGHRSRSMDLFLDQSFDYVITVCDKSREVCPAFGGTGQQIHWGFADPVGIDDPTRRQEAFFHTAHKLKVRIEHFLITLPVREINESR